MSFPAEPSMRWRDLRFSGTARWTEVDDVASRWLGRPCLALPSVRVGLAWALEFAGLRRHRSHVLVPRYVGRCILNTLGRVALPVEVPTMETQAVVVVDQYGLRQDLSALVPEFRRRGWLYVEDSPYGIGVDEAPGDGSLGRFIGLGKVLPVAQGALLTTANDDLAADLRKRREQHSLWSWPVWLTMARLRFRRQTTMYSQAADAAYEMYMAARGGNRWLRGNIDAALRRGHAEELESANRAEALRARIAERTLRPDLSRLGYVVPFPVMDQEAGLVHMFRTLGFDASVYHVDTARNLLAPAYTRCMLIPLNPRIPRASFDALVSGLAA